MNYTKITLGELLSSESPAIKRNAIGILKQLQKEKMEDVKLHNCQQHAYCRICGRKTA